MGYEFLDFSSALADVAGAHGGNADRRDRSRDVTMFRVARVLARGDQGLARLLNISDWGLMLSIKLDLMLNDEVTVDLSESCTLTGYVVWRDADWCGLKLKEAIDAAALLRRLSEERHAPGARQLRLPIEKRVVVTSELGIQIVRLRDISQRGAKLVHDGRFHPGLLVKIQIRSGVERRGVVRWSRDGIAGVQFTKLLSVDDLGSINSL